MFERFVQQVLFRDVEILEDLEDTLPTMASYLTIADSIHPKLLLGDPNESGSEAQSGSKIRLTQHHAAALVAYGFPKNSTEIQRAFKWFATSFDDKYGTIDQFEMTRLEALLNIYPEEASVYPRLRRLVQQRSLTNGFFEIDRDDKQDGQPLIFDTLWALKCFMMARHYYELDDLIDEKALEESINQIIRICHHDKDLALALRLQYQLRGKLESHHIDYLNDLLRRAADYGGVWGISRPDNWGKVKSIVDAMHEGTLRPSLIDEDHAHIFREIIRNTCYVIENLSTMVADYPEVEEPVRQAMILWWQQFKGKNAIGVLNSFFEEEYDFLLILFRTLVTVSAFIGEPPGKHFFVEGLREMARNFQHDRYPEMKNIIRSLRRWIGINIEDYQTLKLGLSSANVVRIKPNIYDPTDEEEVDMLGTSLIVKYGPIAEIEKERSNYEALPDYLVEKFVSIPKPKYVTRSRKAFVIMQDLNDFHTLYESYSTLLKGGYKRLSRELSLFLGELHQVEEQGQFGSANHLREIYTLPMFLHLDFIVEKMQMYHLFDRRFIEMEGALNELLAGIISNLNQIERFPLVYMHGDLHTRNIMLKQVPVSPKSKRRKSEFRLIDLESVRSEGDAAHDIGQLLVDLHLLQLPGKKNHPSDVIDNLRRLSDTLEKSYLENAQEQGDDTFLLRLEMGRARAFIRIAKGLTKRSEEHFSNGEVHKVEDAVISIHNYTEGAVGHLEKVYKALASSS